MQLRLGQSVHGTDGPFGELADIVVDPVPGHVTHLVVEPRHRHHLARLVPIWLVREDGERLIINLDCNHIRQLQDVVYSEFLRISDPLPTGDTWDIGHQNVVAMPYYQGVMRTAAFDDYVNISYDRIPKGECEIRRDSNVRTADDRIVGRVEGFMIDGEDLTGVLVLTGRPGLRHHVLVPMGSVSEVSGDNIVLDIGQDVFRRLPTPTGLTGPAGAPFGLRRIEHKAGRAVARLRARITDLVWRSGSTA